VVTGLEHLHQSRALAEDGLRLALEAYTCHVFLDWREVVDDGVQSWGTLAERLAGRGVPSVEEAMRLLLLEPVHAALRALLEPPRRVAGGHLPAPREDAPRAGRGRPTRAGVSRGRPRCPSGSRS
jgi:hypothetical protein